MPKENTTTNTRRILIAIVEISPKPLHMDELVALARPYFKSSMDIKSSVNASINAGLLRLEDDLSLSSPNTLDNKYQKDKQRILLATNKNNAAKLKLKAASTKLDKAIAEYIKNVLNNETPS